MFTQSKPVVIEPELDETNQDETNQYETNQDETNQYETNQYKKTTKYSFGNILYSDEDSDIVTIENPSLFCKNVKIWNGYEKVVKIRKTDENGNTKFYTKNRIEDKNRSKQIALSIMENKYSPTTMIQISELIKEDGEITYYCWDGQHRKGAIKILQDDTLSHPIIKKIFKCIIYRNDTQEGITQKFISINQSISVPQALLDTLKPVPIMSEEDINNEKIKNIVDSVVIKIVNQFSEYSKPSQTPNLPHFNMNNLIQDLMVYLKENKLFDITPIDFFQQIMILNSTLGDKYNNMILTKQISKQLKKRLDKLNKHVTKCYLFIESDNFTDFFQPFISDSE